MPFVSERFLPLAAVVGLIAFAAAVGDSQSSPVVKGVRSQGNAASPPPPRETILYRFHGGRDGAAPDAGLIGDAQASLYGTTSYGGSHIGSQYCYKGCGTVFKLTPSVQGYTKETLYRFAGGSDGENPDGGLLADASGALYGVTSGGGNTVCHADPCGVVFKLTPTPAHAGYTESVLYRFQGYPSDGALPFGSLVMDATGALYGATAFGGETDSGTIYKLTKTAHGYRETMLHTFGVQDAGLFPSGQLLMHGRGRLFGVSGRGNGAVFDLVPEGPAYLFRVLYRFRGGDDGNGPSGVIVDASGTLWGTTAFGGGGGGGGTAFKLSPAGLTYTESVVYRFGNLRHDGEGPSGPLLAGRDGALYGVTSGGGGYRTCTLGCGVVFELQPHNGQYEERVLHHFKGSPDGGFPNGGLLRLPNARVLYGTTWEGGLRRCFQGCGTVFAIDP